MRSATIFLATGLLLSTAATASDAVHDRCQRESGQPAPPVAQALARVAQDEHVLMGGQLIDTRGGLIRQGIAESEATRLAGAGQVAWQRVLDYWDAVPGQYTPWVRTFGSEARQRIATVDRPWSAAFISHLMRQGHLADDQFNYSAAHHDYVRGALQAADAERPGRAMRYAYRACDLARTAPRVGDLMCFARGRGRALQDYASVRTALAAGALPMHCDLVVQRGEHTLSAIGGNVVQSVTRRRMVLDAQGRIAPEYLESAHAENPALPTRYLSQQPWSVLLQLRSAAFAPAAPR